MIERHQVVAVLIFAGVTTFLIARDGLTAQAFARSMILLLALLPILGYRLIAWLSSFGFPEFFARDFKSPNHPGPYAFFFWLLYLVVCAFVVFGWSLY